MIFSKQTKWRKGILNEIALEELDENANKSTTFWLKVWQDWALAREYDVDIDKSPILSC
jgi:hypothetical protein